jgi:hypothetical protein
MKTFIALGNESEGIRTVIKKCKDLVSFKKHLEKTLTKKQLKCIYKIDVI